MAEIYNNSGEFGGVEVPAPKLTGAFHPAIDQRRPMNSLGLVIPFGGGGMARRYAEDPAIFTINNKTRVSPIAFNSAGEPAKYAISMPGLGAINVAGWGGTPGLPGAPGPEGKEGEEGLLGAVGLAGPRGKKGKKGPIGDLGPQGPMGPVEAASCPTHTRFRNVKRCGVWIRGNTYTFEMFRIVTDTLWTDGDGRHWEEIDSGTIVVLSSYPVFLTRVGADNWEPLSWWIGKHTWAGWTEPTGDEMLLYPTKNYTYTPNGWETITITVPADTPPGDYGILWLRFSCVINDYPGGGYWDRHFHSGPTITERESLYIKII